MVLLTARAVRKSRWWGWRALAVTGAGFSLISVFLTTALASMTHTLLILAVWWLVLLHLPAIILPLLVTLKPHLRLLRPAAVFTLLATFICDLPQAVFCACTAVGAILEDWLDGSNNLTVRALCWNLSVLGVIQGSVTLWLGVLCVRYWIKAPSTHSTQEEDRESLEPNELPSSFSGSIVIGPEDTREVVEWKPPTVKLVRL